VPLLTLLLEYWEHIHDHLAGPIAVDLFSRRYQFRPFGVWRSTILGLF